jgi:hypothetical protein
VDHRESKVSAAEQGLLAHKEKKESMESMESKASEAEQGHQGLRERRAIQVSAAREG